MTGAVVLATHQGLGYLARAFYDNGLIDKVLVVKHSTRKNNYDWFQNRVETEAELLKGIDTLLFFETPFNWKLIVKARELGIKTVLMPMHECTNYPFPYEPDLLINPSELEQNLYGHGIRINVPVDVKWKKRTKALVFVHNAGNGGLGGRNGTKELLAALRFVKSPARFIIRSQVQIDGIKDSRVEYRIGQFGDIWSEGDVFVFPEKFNGLSLPLQEAYASGMLVMAGDRFPINTWLPKEPLIPVSFYREEFIASKFQSAQFRPEDIAKTIDAWYGKDIESFSLRGREWAKENSWGKLKSSYVQILSK